MVAVRRKKDMGTRSLTVFKNGDGEEIAVLYRQMDGYPAVHGAELSAFLEGKRLVNGMGSNDGPSFNGPECMAASVIAHFKTDRGAFYLYPAGTRDCGEEYIYTVEPEEGIEGTIKVTVAEA